MKVMKVELLIIDFDGLGENGIIDALENTKYPNRCISPDVKTVTTVDIGEWSDDHPLNSSGKCERAYLDLFPLTPHPLYT